MTDLRNKMNFTLEEINSNLKHLLIEIEKRFEPEIIHHAKALRVVEKDSVVIEITNPFAFSHIGSLDGFILGNYKLKRLTIEKYKVVKMEFGNVTD